MDPLVVSVAIFVIVWLAIKYFWSPSLFRSNKIPGPWGFPVFGYMPFLSEAPYLDFMKLAKKYGGLFQVPLGAGNAVVLNDFPAVRDTLIDQPEIFSARPYTFIFEKSLKRWDIVTSDGPRWREQRRFTIHQLRNYGVGKSGIETFIMEEVEKVMHHLETHPAEKLEMSHMFFIPIVNIVWSIVGHKKFDYDQRADKFRDVIRYNFTHFKCNNNLNFMPWMRFLPGSTFNEFINSHNKVIDFLEEEVEMVLETYKDGVVRNFIDAYVAEIRSRPNAEKEDSAFQRKYLVGVLYNFFNAGAETTEHTVAFSILYMTVWPEIQIKVQEELNRVVGPGRLPTYSDRQQLPYTEATLMEIHRFASVVPLSIPHAPTRTVTVKGHVIHKGTFCFQNIYAIHHNPEYWGDPHIFRPERFLDANGKIVRSKYLMPFSVGSRVCPGEPLARMELFLFFTCLMHRFNFRYPSGETPPSLEPLIALTLQPQPFHVIASLRHSN